MPTRFPVPAIAAMSQLLMIAPVCGGIDAAGAPGPSVPASACVDIVGGLPLPFGVGVFYMHQDAEYDVTSLHATSPIFGPVTGLGPNAISRVHNKVDEVNVKLNWWAQPWLNFHGIFGWVDGQSDASFSSQLPPQLTALLGGMKGIKVDYNGIVYGGGMTLAAGYKNFFASVTGNYTWASVALQGGAGLALNDANNIGTLVITPKVGWLFDQGTVWVGAFYQSTEHTQYGGFNLGPPLGTVNFNATVKDTAPWNFIMGGEYKFTEHWVLTGEVGLGGREQVLVGTTYRF